MSLADGKILFHLKDRRRLVVDARDVYYLEAQRDETDVRMKGARRLLDVHAVNPGRVREIRLADGAWQVQLEPPVNKVLPVSRRSLAALLATYRVR